MNPREDIEFLKEVRAKKRRKTRVIFFVMCVILLSFILITQGATIIASVINPKTENASQTFVSHITQFVFSGNRTLKGLKEDRINILLLGIGGAGHEGPQLSDTMILASIQPSAKKIALLSIPRDLAVEIPDHGIVKINAANAYGEEQGAGKGGELAQQVVAKMFDLPVHYWVRVNFKAFEEMVNHVGGITINVEREFTDSNFPDGTGHRQTIVFEKGVQTFDGTQALQFARSRHGTNGENSDFARAKRQQLILHALKNTFKKNGGISNVETALRMVRSLLTYTETNINMLTLANTAQDLFTLTDATIAYHILTPDPVNGLLEEVNNEYGYFLVPKFGDYSEIAAFVATIFNNDSAVIPASTPALSANTEKATIAILNGTWEAGLAKKIANTLASNDLKVLYVGNTEARDRGQTMIYPLNQYNRTKRAMGKISPLLNVQNAQTNDSPPHIPETPKVDIIIVVGKDNASYATSTPQ